MDTAANKSVATDFFARFNANDIVCALVTLTDDAIW